MARKHRRSFGRLLLAAVLLSVAAASWWVMRQLEPVASGPERYVRFGSGVALPQALARLEREKFIRNAQVTALYARFRRKGKPVAEGTYRLRPGWTSDELLAALENPIRQMVRIPETNWAARTARLLEQKGIVHAEEYLRLYRSPQEFQSMVGFPLPQTGTLEGYLYPDTYDLPPEIGARAVIERQLRNFERRVWKGLAAPKNLRRALIVASMVELEVAKDFERPKVAGVIENRLRKGMPLQIDATVLYALQEWRRLYFRDYRETDSPYNTYRNKGLPPGPICSPSLPSIRAALNPAQHEYLYYVALPNGTHLFSRTYDEHRRNIQRRRAALAAQEARSATPGVSR